MYLLAHVCAPCTYLVPMEATKVIDPLEGGRFPSLPLKNLLGYLFLFLSCLHPYLYNDDVSSQNVKKDLESEQSHCSRT